WRRFAFLSMATTSGAIALLIYISGQRGIVPYVVAVDKVGQVAAIDRAEQSGRPDRKVIVATLSRWIVGIRSVYLDGTAQKRVILESYAFVNSRGPAFQVLNEYMSSKNPFERAQTETVSVNVETILPLTEDTWRIEWREETRSRDGKLNSST